MSRHHTVMVSSSSGVHAPADGGGGGVDVTLELSELREMDKWKAMVSCVELYLATAARRALSYHLPASYQATIPLMHSGLDTNHRTPAHGGGYMWHVELDIANAFEVGDGCRIRYRSLACTNKADAQKLACVEMLCLLLVSAPSKVQLHDSFWVHGSHSIDALLLKAREIQQVRQFTPNTLAFRCAVPGQQTPQANQPMAVPEPSRHVVENKVDDQRVIQIMMRSLWHGKVYGPYELPQVVALELNTVLPRGGLLPFLKRHPTLFGVQTDGTKTTNGNLLYSFAVYPQIIEAADVGAVGIQVSPGGPSSAAGGGGHAGTVGMHAPPGLVLPHADDVGTVGIRVSPGGFSAPADGGHGGIVCMHAPPGVPATLGLVPRHMLPVHIATWTVQNVVQYLEHVELAHLEPVIRLHGINGFMLLEATLIDLKTVGLSPIQIKKIFQCLPWRVG
jgi:hypothetical protein